MNTQPVHYPWYKKQDTDACLPFDTQFGWFAYKSSQSKA